MKGFLIAMLCTAPLMVGYNAYEPVQPVPQMETVETIESVETVYRASMGCDLPDCTDPAHFHWCVPDCAEPCHYHDCPVGCADPTHPHCNQCWETAPEDSPEWVCPYVDCTEEGCTDPTHRHDCPAGCVGPACRYEDCPAEDCPNVCQPHPRGCGRGRHGRWHW